MFNIGPWELALILLVALIVVGPGKLPEVAKSIGKGINEFKKVTTGYKREFDEAMRDVEQTVKPESYDPPPDSKPEVINTVASTAPIEKEANQIQNMANEFDSTVLGHKEKVEEKS